ncbi:MAG: hypothetical protein ABEK36_06205 [Candidatus Aenigmatarchaeota archaeon]
MKKGKEKGKEKSKKNNSIKHGMYLKGFMWCHRCIFAPHRNNGKKICPYYEDGKQCRVEIEQYKKMFREISMAFGLNKTHDKLLLDRMIMDVLRAKRGERYEAFMGITSERERLLDPRTGQITKDVFETPVSKYIDRIESKIIKFSDALKISRKSRTPQEVKHDLGDLSKMLTGMRTKTTTATDGKKQVKVVETEYSKKESTKTKDEESREEDSEVIIIAEEG